MQTYEFGRGLELLDLSYNKVGCFFCDNTFVHNRLADILIILDWEDQGVLLQHSAEAEQTEHDIEWDHKVPGSGPLQKPTVRYESMKL